MTTTHHEHHADSASRSGMGRPLKVALLMVACHRRLLPAARALEPCRRQLDLPAAAGLPADASVPWPWRAWRARRSPCAARQPGRQGGMTPWTCPHATITPATRTTIRRSTANAEGLKDPVCGMTVTDAVRAPRRARRPALLLLQREVPGQVRRRAGALCRSAASRQLPPKRAAQPRRHDLHLPDAPGDPPGPSGQLPQVRHDARARDARRWTTTRTRSWPTSRAASGGRCRSPWS